jgi:hypothetical protein
MIFEGAGQESFSKILCIKKLFMQLNLNFKLLFDTLRAIFKPTMNRLDQPNND